MVGACSSLGGCRLFPSTGWRGPAGRKPRELPHAGSGIIVGRGGFVLTTAAVTAGARRVVVVASLQERRKRYPATIVAVDRAMGLVLLRVGADLDWILPWTHADGQERGRAFALGWPMLAASSEAAHEAEMAVCATLLFQQRLAAPLSPGFEGGAVVDDNGDGLGVITSVTDSPRVVCAREVCRFLEDHGVRPRPPIGVLKRPWRIRLRQLQNNIVRVERLPPRGTAGFMPALVRRTALPVQDIVGVRPLRDETGHTRLVEVHTWRTARGFERYTLHLETGKVVSVVRMPDDRDPRVPSFPREVASGEGRFRLDRLGRVTFLSARGRGGVEDWVAINGFRRFRTHAAFQATSRGDLLLVGDAIVAVPSGTVLWRLDVRPGDPVALLEDGSGLVVGRRFGRYRNRVEYWRMPAVSRSLP